MPGHARWPPLNKGCRLGVTGEADVTDEHVRTASAAPAMTRRDQALTAAILAFFGMAWFGWGHDGAPSVLAVLLDVGLLDHHFCHRRADRHPICTPLALQTCCTNL
jgi:predicted NAD/FAD-binding protein